MLKWQTSLNLLIMSYREHPLFLMFMQLAVTSIFKSYPTVGDTAFYLAFLPVWSYLHRCKFVKDRCIISHNFAKITAHFIKLSEYENFLIICFVSYIYPIRFVHVKYRFERAFPFLLFLWALYQMIHERNPNDLDSVSGYIYICSIHLYNTHSYINI